MMQLSLEFRNACIDGFHLSFVHFATIEPIVGLKNCDDILSSIVTDGHRLPGDSGDGRLEEFRPLFSQLDDFFAADSDTTPIAVLFSQIRHHLKTTDL